jgi:hypothetical protein
MRRNNHPYSNQSRWQQVRGKNPPNWAILTPDDLPKTNWRYIKLVAKLEARYRAEKEAGKEKTNLKSEDFSI